MPSSLYGSSNLFKAGNADTYKLLFSHRFMSRGCIVNIKLSAVTVFRKTQPPVNLSGLNLVEFAGGADIAEYEYRRKHAGLPSKHKGHSKVLYLLCKWLAINFK